MTAHQRVSEIERQLCAIHKENPHVEFLVVQLCAIAKTALATVEERWPRHDKRRHQSSEPDLFA